VDHGLDLVGEMTRRGGIVDEATVCKWAVQICDALHYLHTHKPPVVYRDLKPANLILDDKTERVMLVGFGIAHTVRPTEKGVVAIGTMGYAPPELFAGKAEPRSDIYSLGATMFHMLTGLDPRDNPLLIFDFSKNPRPRQINPSITPEIERILMKAVAHRPEERQASALEFMRELEADRPSASPVSPSYPVAPFPSPAMEWVFCGHCGEKIGANQPFCSHCGSRLPMSASVREAAPDGYVVGAPEKRAPEPGPTSEETPIYVDENVQFTVFQPKVVRPLEWYPLLAFAHLSERRSDANEDEPDPIEEVGNQARKRLGDRLDGYKNSTQESSQAIPREGELTFLPNIPGVEFNPPRRSFFWMKPVHCEDFDMRVSPSVDGQTLRGRLTVLLGSILIAEVNLSIRVESRAAKESEKASFARPYRKIFASYSHRDVDIVEQFENYARAIGDRYLRDLTHLRAGEVWSDRLEQMIAEADIFQLFWSSNAVVSSFVRQEWECALRLRRPNFIRPTYWEEPLPRSPDKSLPPEELLRLHFQRIHRVAASKSPGSRHKTIITPAGTGTTAQQPPEPMTSQPRAAEPDVVAGPSRTAALCPQCAQPNSVTRSFCASCGARLTFSKTIEMSGRYAHPQQQIDMDIDKSWRSAPQYSKRKSLIWVSIAMLLLLAMVVLIILFYPV
jgi:serine/threonine protein kinase